MLEDGVSDHLLAHYSRKLFPAASHQTQMTFWANTELSSPSPRAGEEVAVSSLRAPGR